MFFDDDDDDDEVSEALSLREVSYDQLIDGLCFCIIYVVPVAVVSRMAERLHCTMFTRTTQLRQYTEHQH